MGARWSDNSEMREMEIGMLYVCFGHVETSEYDKRMWPETRKIMGHAI